MSTLKTGKVKTTTIADELDTESTDVTNVINGSAKAWVNFNGTGAIAIRGSFNVSSLVDNTTGQYTVNFITAMPDANYAISGSSGNGNGWGSYDFAQQGAGTATAVGSCRFDTYISQSAGKADVDQACLIIHR